MTDAELNSQQYPIGESINNQDLPYQGRSNEPEQGTEPIMETQMRTVRSIEEPLQDEDTVMDNGHRINNNNNTITNNGTNRYYSPNNNNDYNHGTESGSETDEFVIERIVSHVINGDEDHPCAEIGEPLYRVRWYGYAKEDDTYEPVRNLPYNQILGYHKRKKIPLPDNIKDAQSG